MKHANKYEIRLRRNCELETYCMTGDLSDVKEGRLEIYEWDEEGHTTTIGMFLNWEYCVRIPDEKDAEDESAPPVGLT